MANGEEEERGEEGPCRKRADWQQMSGLLYELGRFPRGKQDYVRPGWAIPLHLIALVNRLTKALFSGRPFVKDV